MGISLPAKEGQAIYHGCYETFRHHVETKGGF
jgi:hypothetical protein